MTPIEIIKKAYDGKISNIARETGISYDRLRKSRLKNDDTLGTMTLNEFWRIQRHGWFTGEEVMQIARWKA